MHIAPKMLASLILCIFSFSSFSQAKSYKVNSIAFYNLENLFDTIRNEQINDESYTPLGGNHWDTEKYNNKLLNMSKVISQIGTNNQFTSPPAILGVSEIENIDVLEDLIQMPDLSPFQYQIVHYDSPDERGIDTGLIYRPELFEVTSSSHHFVELPDTTDRTRDILLVSGKLEGEPIHILVNHWPSRSGGERRSMPGRKAAAETAKQIVDSLNQQEAQAKIIIMGDFNDDPISPSIAETLDAKTKIKKLSKTDLFNPYYDLYKKGFGTTAWRDSWSLFDMIIVSNSLLQKQDPDMWRYVKAGRYNPEWLIQQDGKYKGYPLRTSSFGNYMNGYSDHFPVYIYVAKELSPSN